MEKTLDISRLGDNYTHGAMVRSRGVVTAVQVRALSLHRYLGSTEETLLTLVANIIFWLLLADAFWMAANKKTVEEVNHGNRSVASRLRDRMPWRQDRRETEQHKSLVEAYQMSQRALE